MKRYIAVLTCLVVLLSLCACGRARDEAAKITRESDIEVPFYTREALQNPYPDTLLEAAVGTGESIVACGVDSRGDRRLFRLDVSDRSFTLIEGVSPGYVETMDGLSDGRAILSYYDESAVLTVCEIGADNHAATAPLALPMDLEGTLIFDLRAVEIGYLFTAYEGDVPCLYVVDRQGALVSRAEYKEYNTLYILRRADDSLALACVREGRTDVQLLSEDLSVAEQYGLSMVFGHFEDGGSSGEVLGVMPLGKACFVELETGDLRAYANFAGEKISVKGFVPLSDTEFFGISDGKPAIWTQSGGQERSTLKMYTLVSDASNLSRLREPIDAFNNSSDQYYIELVDYGVYGARAETMLAADIVAGNAPDIYDMNSLSGANCYANGLLENLMPYFEADSEIDYEDILAGVRRVIERDGAVYELIPQFSVNTMFAPASVVHAGDFTVDDLLRLAEEYGPEKLFGEAKSRDRLLREAIIYCSDFIDERTAQCSFDSPDFIKLLELAKTLPEAAVNSDYCEVYFGNSLLYHTAVEGLGTAGGLAEVEALYRGDWRSVGFPSAKGTGVTLSAGLRLGMSAASGHKDGVWAFFKYLMSSGYQWSIERGMPVIENVLEGNIDSQIHLGATYSLGMMREDEQGNFVPESLKVGPPSDKLKAQLWELIDSMDGINEYDPALDEIVQSEAAKFFAGDQTSQEAAAAIQSRASIYMSEQYG